MSDGISKAAGDVIAERVRQQAYEGYTPAHDDCHGTDELAAAAAAYALAGTLNPRWRTMMRKAWPWQVAEFKPLARNSTVTASLRRNLVKAGALILAAIEAIDRQAEPWGQWTRDPSGEPIPALQGQTPA